MPHARAHITAKNRNDCEMPRATVAAVVLGRRGCCKVRAHTGFFRLPRARSGEREIDRIVWGMDVKCVSGWRGLFKNLENVTARGV